jgi:4'-phosphopantetheinyl transferase
MNDIESGSFPRLAPDQLQLWRVTLDASTETIAAMSECISIDERQRADRFMREIDRRRFILSHAALRMILGRHLGIAPLAVALANRAGGKPELASAAAGCP